ncbi:DUF397 domain-containing protein [Streptomyces ossamyceticus]|nr:DUF397 domain-containing protein [Streptomyces ossamyceticus]
MSTEELAWFKSSHSSGAGGECLEAAYTWRKPSRSGGEGGERLEISLCSPRTIHLRDSKNPAAPHITFSPTAWATFLPGC